MLEPEADPVPQNDDDDDDDAASENSSSIENISDDDDDDDDGARTTTPNLGVSGPSPYYSSSEDYSDLGSGVAYRSDWSSCNGDREPSNDSDSDQRGSFGELFNSSLQKIEKYGIPRLFKFPPKSIGKTASRRDCCYTESTSEEEEEEEEEKEEDETVEQDDSEGYFQCFVCDGEKISRSPYWENCNKNCFRSRGTRTELRLSTILEYTMTSRGRKIR